MEYSVLLRTMALTGVPTLILCVVINSVVSTPYMDEIFHVPQTQCYCRGELYQWDSKITTLPGFHLLTALYGRIVNIALGGTSTELCHLFILRSMNWILWLVNMYLLYTLRRRLYDDEVWDACYWCVSLSLLPFYCFYMSLLYTDIISMTLLLSCHLAFICDKSHTAAICGFGATLVRQTNVVWVAFFLWDSVHGFLKIDDCKKLDYNLQILSKIKDACFKVWRSKWVLVNRYWSTISLFPLFITFVALNGGIVVGDRSSHRAALHWAQIPYLFGIIIGCLPFLYLNVLLHKRPLRIADLVTVAALTVCLGLLLFYGRIAHPYLLGDNRHISFYVWRRYLSKKTYVAPLMPIAGISAFLTIRTLTESKGQLWFLAWIICSAVTLVPSGLLEFRYFLPSMFIFAIHQSAPRRKMLHLQFGLYMVVNIWMIWLFLARPFEWIDGTIVRFIW